MRLCTCEQLQRTLTSEVAAGFGAALALLTMTTTKLLSWILYSLNGVVSLRILPVVFVQMIYKFVNKFSTSGGQIHSY